MTFSKGLLGVMSAAVISFGGLMNSAGARPVRPFEVAPPAAGPIVNAPPIPAQPGVPMNGVDGQGYCTKEFIFAYMSTARHMAVIGEYANANVTPPNLVETAFACRALTSAFPNTTCKGKTAKGDVVAQTSDLARQCVGVDGLMMKFGVKLPDPSQAGEASPLALLKASSIRVKVQDSAQLLRMLQQSNLLFAIGGTLQDFQQSLLSPGDVRCGLEGAQGAGLLAPGQVLQGLTTIEEFPNGTRVSHVIFAPGTLAITCLSQTGRALSINDIRGAFGSMLSIAYAR